MAINQLAIVEGIVGLILSTAAVDTVAVFGSGFTQLFPNARPLQDQVRENSRVMDHPLESGQLISDYKVILPIEIEMPMMVSSAYYLGTYQQIKAAYLSSELLTVLTRTGSYPNMIISEMPHQEDPERYNSITILLRFRQVQLVQPSVTGTSAKSILCSRQPNSGADAKHRPATLEHDRRRGDAERCADHTICPAKQPVVSRDASDPGSGTWWRNDAHPAFPRQQSAHERRLNQRPPAELERL